MSRSAIRNPFGRSFSFIPHAPTGGTSSLDRPPNSPTGRVVNWISFGRTSSLLARRGVNTPKINPSLGQNWTHIPTLEDITIPYADGSRNLLIDAWQGSLPEENIRYANGQFKSSILHADSRLRALGLVSDGGPTLPWLTEGVASGISTLTDRGIWLGIYSGRLRWPTFQPTTSPPHSWPAPSLSYDTYNDLSNWRLMFEPFLSSGGAFIVLDQGATATSSDPEFLLQTILENPGTHTGNSLGISAYQGSFTNGQARRLYTESVGEVAIAGWSHSFAASYYNFEQRLGDPLFRQPADCLYPPIILCEGVHPDDPGYPGGSESSYLYAKALSLLQAHANILVAIRERPMLDLGLNLSLLRSL